MKKIIVRGSVVATGYVEYGSARGSSQYSQGASYSYLEFKDADSKLVRFETTLVPPIIIPAMAIGQDGTFTFLVWTAKGKEIAMLCEFDGDGGIRNGTDYIAGMLDEMRGVIGLSTIPLKLGLFLLLIVSPALYFMDSKLIIVTGFLGLLVTFVGFFVWLVPAITMPKYPTRADVIRMIAS